MSKKKSPKIVGYSENINDAEFAIKMEEPEEVKAELVKFGLVDCPTILNIRKEPSVIADILVAIPNRAEVIIDPTYKNENWYKVTTATKVEGYGMKQFIAIRK